jgi:short-subunit dehydrogenase
MLVPCNARLVFAARSEEKLKKLTREVQEAGGEALSVAADFTRAEEIERVFAATAEVFGPPDVLINSAGQGETSSISHR